MPMPPASPTSSGQTSQLLHARPDGSLNTVGVRCSANQVSLLELPPSTWWPACATPQRKPSGKVRSVTAPDNAVLLRPGNRGWRYLASPHACGELPQLSADVVPVGLLEPAV